MAFTRDALQFGPWYRQMMSGRPAVGGDAPLPRLLVHGGGSPDDAFDVFEVVAASGDVIQVRSAFLFEVGEQLRVRIEHSGTASDAVARVRAHVGPDDARVTELEILERDEQGAPPDGAGA
jgi:D-serine deaminase-like pyridoxal phosphate-dependent protein